MPELERLDDVGETGTPGYRLDVMLADDAATVMLKIAKNRDLSMRATVERAIVVLDFIEDEVAAGKILGSIETDWLGRYRAARELIMIDNPPRPRSLRSTLLRRLTQPFRASPSRPVGDRERTRSGSDPVGRAGTAGE